MFRYFLIIIACYLLVRFIFGFIIPVVTATLSMRKKMQQMQNQGGFQNRQDENASNINKQATTSAKPSSSDYIEFEEVK